MPVTLIRKYQIDLSLIDKYKKSKTKVKEKKNPMTFA